jgi:hypothetical protein
MHYKYATQISDFFVHHCFYVVISNTLSARTSFTLFVAINFVIYDTFAFP